MNMLDKSQEMLITLLSAGIRKRKIHLEYTDGVQWDKLLHEAYRHQVATLIYRPLADDGKELGVPEGLLKELKVRTAYEGMMQERNYASIGRILRSFSAAGIPVIVLKGLVLRELYPEPGLRTMGDFDFLFRPDDIDKAFKVMGENGYKLDVDIDKHAVYTHKVFPNIELHRSMAPMDMFENCGAFEDHAWQHAIQVEISGARALSLDPTDKAVYLVMHMASHVISGGFGLRQLCDFVLLIETYREELNWEEFHSFIHDLGLATFTDVLFEVCRQMFGLKRPPEYDRPRDLTGLKAGDLIKDIFDAGVFGKDDKDRITANRMLYYAGGSEAKTFAYRLRIFVNLLFPSAKKLDVRYTYAKKRHFLLPAAWLHRFFYNLIRKDIDFAEKTAILAPEIPTRIYNSRSALLEELGLIGR